MKKSELKVLLKIIAEEVVSIKETKGLSGMKKAPESTEHTEKVADSKDLTGPAPKEKEEGKKLPVVKKPANPQKVGSINEESLAQVLVAGAGAGTVLVGAGVIVTTFLAFLYGKATGGKVLPPLNLVFKDKEVRIEDKKEELEAALQPNESQLPLPVEDLMEIAETMYNNGSWKKDILALSTDIKDAIEKKLRDSGRQEEAELIKRTNIGSAHARKIINSVETLLVKRLKAVEKSTPAEKPTGTPPPPTEPPVLTKENRRSLKNEIIQMIREEIDEMARTAGAVDPKYRKNIDGKWVIMGHPNQAKYPDGTPTTEPKGPYVKKEKSVDMGGTPTRTPSTSFSGSTRSRETELAVADILKHDPEATDEEIAEELASRSDSGEPLNLAPAVIANAISLAKDEEDKPNNANEPAANDLASKEKAEKQRKIANLRAYLMRKRGIKPTK